MSDLCSVQSKVKQTVDGEPEWMGCSTAPVVCRRQEHQQWGIWLSILRVQHGLQVDVTLRDPNRRTTAWSELFFHKLPTLLPVETLITCWASEPNSPSKQLQHEIQNGYVGVVYYHYHDSMLEVCELYTYVCITVDFEWKHQIVIAHAKHFESVQERDVRVKRSVLLPQSLLHCAQLNLRLWCQIVQHKKLTELLIGEVLHRGP